jgi:hypothetical protein
LGQKLADLDAHRRPRQGLSSRKHGQRGAT